MSMVGRGAAARVMAHREADPRYAFTEDDRDQGEDRTGSVEVVVDGSGWILEITLRDLPADLRTADALGAAVREASRSAQLRRLVARTPAPSAAEAERGAEIMDGRRGLVPPPLPAPLLLPGVEQLHERYLREGLPARQGDDRTARSFRGRSRGSEIVAVVSWLEGLDLLEVDGDWLASASRDDVHYSLREAFAEVYEEGERAA
jgi:hypothetical protein